MNYKEERKVRMKKFITIYKIALIGLLAAGILSGCGEKERCKELMEETASKMEAVTSIGGNMAFDVAMNVSGDVDGSSHGYGFEFKYGCGYANYKRARGKPFERNADIQCIGNEFHCGC